MTIENGNGIDLAFAKLAGELADKEAALTAIEEELRTAADAIQPLAHGEPISDASKIALAGMVNISIHRALALLGKEPAAEKAASKRMLQ